MSQNPTNEGEYFKDHLVIRHTDGRSDKFTLPEDTGVVTRIGRELDNDIVLTDARASRYHAIFRRTADGIEIKDLNSANGTLVGSTRLEADIWHKLMSGQMVQLGETRIFWEKAASAQSTVMMTVPKQRDETVIVPAQTPTPPPPSPARPPASAPSPTPPPTTSILPWAVGLAAILLLLIVAGVGLFFVFGGSGTPTATPIVVAEQPTATEHPTPSLSQQTTGGVPTATPTPAGPQLAIPMLEIISSELRPFRLSGGLLSTDKIALVVTTRVQNAGNAGFKLSTNNFIARTLTTGEVFKESGGTLSQEGLSRMGAINRFNDLTLPPGGSVLESLVFDMGKETYDLELVFQGTDMPNPIVLGLGQIKAGRTLAKVLGTPVAEETAVAAAPTAAPSPTPTRPAAIPAPQMVSRSALVGAIAYPVFNGDSYDLYFGQVDGSGSKFFRASASQPAFNADGSRIAFHSWSGASRGLMSMDTSGANGVLLTNFIEDQLPTWTTDSKNIVLLTRRSGGRQSQLLRVDSAKELDPGAPIGEGEYPTIGANGQMAFKGWGQTAYGLRLASSSLEGIQTITNVDQDTAPALSPDGQHIVFMSRREENWDIYLINIDGSGLKRLTDDPANDGLPTWSPDGNAIAFVSNRGGSWAVWAITADGAGLRQLFTMQGSPDGQVGSDTYASRGWAEERISWTKANLK